MNSRSYYVFFSIISHHSISNTTISMYRMDVICTFINYLISLIFIILQKLLIILANGSFINDQQFAQACSYWQLPKIMISNNPDPSMTIICIFLVLYPFYLLFSLTFISDYERKFELTLYILCYKPKLCTCKYVILKRNWKVIDFVYFCFSNLTCFCYYIL